MGLTREDRQDLHAFRAAAKQIRDASVIATGQSVHLRGSRQSGGEMKITAALLDSEPFRSLALSIRLVYQANEPAHFGHICNTLARAGTGDVPSRAEELRARYNAALQTHNPIVAAMALGDKAPYSPRDIFETWLYHGVFHQDPSRKADFDALAQLGDRFLFAVQNLALKLAGRIIDLDDVIADFLQEPRLERILAG